jgi:hypothetical protein
VKPVLRRGLYALPAPRRHSTPSGWPLTLLALAPLQAAQGIIAACVACERPSSATALYRQLLGEEEGGGRPAALAPETHAAALQALLQEVHRAPGGGSSADAALASALALLESQGGALLRLRDAKLLGSVVCKAAAHPLPTAASPSLEPYRIVAAAWPAAGRGGPRDAAAAGEQLFAALLPGVRLALWGVRRQQAGGSSAEELQAQLAAAALAAGRAGSGQALWLLVLAPQQVQGLQPTPSEWAVLLRYARQDVASRPKAQRGLDSAVISVLREVCGRLRGAWGANWASQLPPAAKVRNWALR